MTEPDRLAGIEREWREEMRLDNPLPGNPDEEKRYWRHLALECILANLLVALREHCGRDVEQAALDIPDTVHLIDGGTAGSFAFQATYKRIQLLLDASTEHQANS